MDMNKVNTGTGMNTDTATMTNRNVVFKSLVGSHNYNLATEESDKDYRAFVYPYMDDLYFGREYSNSTHTESEDTSYHDIRKLPDLMMNSNVTFLEVLFSQETVTHNKLHTHLFNLREDIARMNLPYLFDACMGMFYREAKNYIKKSKSGDLRQINKTAASAIRISNFLVRFYETNFEDMKGAIWYKDEDPMRDYILSVKRGEIGVYQMNNMLDILEQEALMLKETYKSAKKDEALLQHMHELVREHTLNHLGIKF